MRSKTLEYLIIALFAAVVSVGFGQRLWQTTNSAQPQLDTVLAQASKGIK